MSRPTDQESTELERALSPCRERGRPRRRRCRRARGCLRAPRAGWRRCLRPSDGRRVGRQVSLSSRTTDATSDGTWPSSTTVGVLSDREMAASSAVLSSTGSWPTSSPSTLSPGESWPPSSPAALSPDGELPTEFTVGVVSDRGLARVGHRAHRRSLYDSRGWARGAPSLPRRCLRPSRGQGAQRWRCLRTESWSPSSPSALPPTARGPRACRRRCLRPGGSPDRVGWATTAGALTDKAQRRACEVLAWKALHRRRDWS